MDIKQEYKLQADNGDPWGSAVSAWFDIAAELYHRGIDLPGSWDYSPGMAADPRDPESYFYSICLESETSDLLRFGNALERYTHNLDRYGLSY